MSKALIVYGTRYGATASTSEEIAKILLQEGLEVRIVNAKQEKVNDIAEYDLVIVGSGIQINRWTSEPEKFLKKFQKELRERKWRCLCPAVLPLRHYTKENLIPLRRQKESILKKKLSNTICNLLLWACLAASTITTKSRGGLKRLWKQIGQK